jgi:hypothetical protein
VPWDSVGASRKLDVLSYRYLKPRRVWGFVLLRCIGGIANGLRRNVYLFGHGRRLPHVVPLLLLFTGWEVLVRRRQDCAKHSSHANQHGPSDSVCPGLLSTKRDDRWRRFQNRIVCGYEQHCLGTPNSGRSYARRAHASRSCPRSWMSPSVGSILGEQGQQPADQCRLYARQHRTGA